MSTGRIHETAVVWPDRCGPWGHVHNTTGAPGVPEPCQCGETFSTWYPPGWRQP